MKIENVINATHGQAKFFSNGKNKMFCSPYATFTSS